MDYFPYLLFLAMLSGLSFIILISVRILDFANTVSKQKLILFKIGLLMLILAPFIYFLMGILFSQTLEIALSNQFIHQISEQHLTESSILPGINVSLCLVIVYGTGSFTMLFRILSSYLNTRKKLISSVPAIIQGQSVFLSEYVKSPLSFGLPITKIYFPTDIKEKWTTREIQMSLAHEKIHIEQFDSLWKLLSLIAQALLFFAPWSYTLHRRFVLEMEVNCDEKTCIKTGADIKEYGDLLLAMSCVQQKNIIFNNMSDSTIKRRFVAMKSKKIKRPLLMLVLSAALLLTASAAIAMVGGITEKKSVYKITSKLLIDGKLVASPHIVANANQKALIVLTNTNNAESQGLRIELVAQDIKNSARDDAIEINYDIQYKDGNDKIHSKPQIIVTPNSEGKISMASSNHHSYELIVLAKRE